MMFVIRDRQGGEWSPVRNVCLTCTGWVRKMTSTPPNAATPAITTARMQMVVSSRRGNQTAQGWGMGEGGWVREMVHTFESPSPLLSHTPALTKVGERDGIQNLLRVVRHEVHHVAVRGPPAHGG